ncbi:MAG: phosphatidylglycerol--prolipoprotein diacylglyceryl transferase [Candidatus Westeberhardia cardiocondylae]|nr:phosphatidylglycerol--prolipoprotein diacylglyceryl transferase [Candidatus Westeberhardia cardiocondylae]
MMYYLFFPQYDPIFFSFGFFSFSWYGFMYFFSFLVTKWFVIKNMRHFFYCKISKEEIINLLYFCFFFMIIFGRIGYVLFYQFSFFCLYPLDIFKIWNGGMSFHGGLLGVVFAILFLCRKKNCFFCLTDLLVQIIPFCLGMGRLANFINGELWGKVGINFPLLMFFPGSFFKDINLLNSNLEYQEIFDEYGLLPRHPVQMYEFFLEGILLFFILNIFVKKFRPLGSVSGLFLIFYGIFRIFSEFFREEDCKLCLFSCSIGQILSFFMVLFGLYILFCSYFF